MGVVTDGCGSERFFLDEAEPVEVAAVVEFAAAVITGNGALDGFYAVDGGKTIGADVGVLALHLTALERQVVKGLLTGDAEVGAGALPLRAVGLDAAAATALVGDEVGKLVLEGAPEFLGLAFLEFRIKLDRSIRPPRTAGGGLHPRVPRNANFPRELV